MYYKGFNALFVIEMARIQFDGRWDTGTPIHGQKEMDLY